MPAGRRAAFLDRDGVLNERLPPHEYVRCVDELRLLPGVGAAVAALEAAGLAAIVVSNQRGIARGIVSWDALRAIEAALQAELACYGARIEAFHYCPHELGAYCACRKPAPGLLLEAAQAHGLDLSRSFLIGDTESDVQAGRAVGCFTIRLCLPDEQTAADARADDLPAAVRDIVLPRLS